MPYQFHVTIHGAKQGALAGETAGKIAGIGFSFDVTSPRDPASGLPTGKHHNGPVTFTKEWGAASPQLFAALVTNEVITSALFEFVAADHEGVERVFHTIRLTNATVTAIHQYVTVAPTGPPTHRALEDVSLTFRGIEITNLAGKTHATDGHLNLY